MIGGSGVKIQQLGKIDGFDKYFGLAEFHRLRKDNGLEGVIC
jgi:hypothetical protein